MNQYAINETNPIPAGYHDTAREVTVDLTDPLLGRITRLRLLTEPGFPLMDLSYCHGVLKDGTPVRVRLPYSQFARKNLKRDLIDMAREAGVYAKGLGLIDDSTISIMRG